MVEEQNSGLYTVTVLHEQGNVGIASFFVGFIVAASVVPHASPWMVHILSRGSY